MKKNLQITIFILIAFTVGAYVRTTFAGSLVPATAPASSMYTLDGIYNKLTNNTNNAVEGAQPFATPGSVASTFHTLKEIYESIPTLDASKIASGTTYMGITGTIKIGLPKTGQTHCSNVYGDVLTCAGSNQDGDLQRGLAHAYVDNGNGTITDNATGLMWQKCSKGQTEIDCSGGTAATLAMDNGSGSFSPAIDYCENLSLATYTDWHVPNIKELMSIVDYSKTSPAIDINYFPQTKSNTYWSSTNTETPSGGMWTVSFIAGSISASFQDQATVYIRCVRS